MTDKDTGTRDQTRREHWLPQASHLAHFCKSGKLQVYRYRSGEQGSFATKGNHFETTPAGVGHERDLYETRALPPNTIEKALGPLEQEFGKILDEKILHGKLPSPQEHRAISYFVSALQARTPANRDHWHAQVDTLIERGRQVALANGSPEAADRFEAELETLRKETFAQVIAASVDVNNVEPLDFSFLVISDDSSMEFITSDHPVATVDFTMANQSPGITPLNKTAETTVPLTPKVALFANTCGITGYRRISANFVREINSRTLGMSRQMVISRSEVSAEEQKNIVRRMPQSLILSYAKLPKGRVDKLLSKIKRKETGQSNRGPKRKKRKQK